MTYFLVKWLHILAAIIAVGANVTYGIWLTQAKKQSEHLLFTLKGIRLIDSKFANVGYVLLLITGFYMQGVSRMPITTPWLLLSIILFVILAVLGMFGYSPLLRKQISIVEKEGFTSPAYAEVAKRSKIVGMILGFLAIIISYLMVLRPTLWG